MHKADRRGKRMGLLLNAARLLRACAGLYMVASLVTFFVLAKHAPRPAALTEEFVRFVIAAAVFGFGYSVINRLAQRSGRPAPIKSMWTY